jgi:hypothetical protein
MMAAPTLFSTARDFAAFFALAGNDALATLHPLAKNLNPCVCADRGHGLILCPHRNNFFVPLMEQHF